MFVLEFERALLPLKDANPLAVLFQLPPELKHRNSLSPMLSGLPNGL